MEREMKELAKELANEVVLPQFSRTDGRIVMAPPLTMEGFNALASLSDDDKLSLGLQRWDCAVWLFPVEWSSKIPAGFEAVNIFHERVVIDEVCGEDQRFGALSFGIRVSKEEALENLKVRLAEHLAEGTADFLYLWGLERQLRYIGDAEICQRVLELLEKAEEPDRYNKRMYQEFLTWLKEAAA